jgi:hypothetical protein
MVSQGTSFEIPVVSLRRIPSKADSDGLKTYIAVVNVSNLPDLSEWRKINVRDPKLNGAVPKAIRQTLDEDPESFLFKNRGLVITVKTARFDNESNILTIEFEDPDVHGLLDGGHTYYVIKDYCSDIEDDNSVREQAFVRMEIMEGFDGDQIRDVVDARNTSNQVKDQSLLELAKSFEGIKAAIASKPYAKLIAYKEYEIMEGTDGKIAKPIDVREVIALMTLFDKDHFGDNNHPILAYSQKAACLKRFKDFSESYEKIYPLLTDILLLWDKIHRDMRGWYENSKAKQNQGARFGRLTGITADRAVKLYFLDETATDIIPTSFKYPILAALRSLVEETNGQYSWGADAEAALDSELGEQLIEVVVSNAIELRNPTKLGKSSSVWDQCYSKAQVWYLKAQAAKYHKMK